MGRETRVHDSARFRHNQWLSYCLALKSVTTKPYIYILQNPETPPTAWKRSGGAGRRGEMYRGFCAQYNRDKPFET